MQSHIKIKLKFKCIIGILPFERKKKQRVIIKLCAKAESFLDYAKVCELVKKSYKEQEFKLLEDSLNYLFTALKAEFKNITKLKITATKPDIIKNARVSVSLKKKFQN